LDETFPGKQTTSRIVGGTPATAGQVPYIYSLRRTSHSCGGSILSETKLITAAHCVQGAAPTAITIRYNSLQHASGGTLVNIASIVVHPQYSSSTIDYDVATMRTAAPLTLGGTQTNADSIALVPAGYDPNPPDSVLVSGWGTTSESGSLSANLLVVNIPVITRAQCNQQYGAGSITARMFCAGVPAGGIDACQGDSGGPYVINVNGQDLLAGETSWGQGCARPNYAGVATNNGPLVAWINAN
jgi:trypsin